jgi:hypothetical protein
MYEIAVVLIEYEHISAAFGRWYQELSSGIGEDLFGGRLTVGKEGLCFDGGWFSVGVVGCLECVFLFCVFDGLTI